MDAGEPRSYEQDIVAPDAELGLQAMKSEMDTIHPNQTWELVELPAGRKLYLANGYFVTNMYPTRTHPNTKLGSLQRDSNKNMWLTMMRYSRL